MKKEINKQEIYRNIAYHLGMINQFITDNCGKEEIRFAFENICETIKLFIKERENGRN